MPFTLHQADTEEEARKSLPGLSWDYQTHQHIFVSHRLDLHDLSLFYHLSDFRQDTAFLGGDVITLRAQVEEARHRIQHPRATEVLALLSKLCDLAVQNRTNLFAFGE